MCEKLPEYTVNKTNCLRTINFNLFWGDLRQEQSPYQHQRQHLALLYTLSYIISRQLNLPHLRIFYVIHYQKPSRLVYNFAASIIEYTAEIQLSMKNLFMSVCTFSLPVNMN